MSLFSEVQIFRYINPHTPYLSVPFKAATKKCHLRPPNRNPPLETIDILRPRLLNYWGNLSRDSSLNVFPRGLDPEEVSDWEEASDLDIFLAKSQSQLLFFVMAYRGDLLY